MREEMAFLRLASHPWLTRCLVGLIMPVAALGLLFVAVSAAARPSCPVPVVLRQRYGFVATQAGWPEAFDYGALRAGWYVDAAHGSYDTPPAGMDRALLLSVHTGYTVDAAQLGPLVDDNPGVIWLIGNEPDCIYQDDVWPEEYARIYHDLYTFIKGRDWTSQISPGGIVQPTPLRLAYLDRVLAEYQARYGRPMPVDLWNIHNAILDELRGGSGADIPPGFPDVNEGVRRDPQDNDDLDIFTDQIWAFRGWMADRGYGGYPLIITEYGILMPEQWYGFDAERVNAFMSATFSILESAADAQLGDPSDGDRLVQRWAWFSLDAPKFEFPTTTHGFNGNLFDPDTTGMTAHGENYASHTVSFPPLAYVDLGISLWNVPPATDLAGPSQTLTRSVQVRVANVGTADSGSHTVTLAYDGPLSGTLAQTLGNLPPITSQWLAFTLTDLQPGGYSFTVTVDPDDLVLESRECNNEATGKVLAPTDRRYLPVVLRPGGGVAGNSSSKALLRPSAEHRAVTGMRPGGVITGFQEFEVPTPGSYPAQIALDGQGAVWITEHEADKIARFDPQTTTWTEYDIPTLDSRPWGLAVDGAGDVWFAETETDQIGRLIVASGTISEYGTLTDDSQPWDVAVADDGTVWFTERNADQIGKLVPSTETMTEYPLPTSGAGPAHIAVRGIHVWFTEPAADQIGRLKTLDGSVYEFDPPAMGGIPQDIVLSPAGDPWFTEMAADQITLFHVSTLGLFFEFPVATPKSEPFGIALEGDVAVWFTERAAGKLGRFSGSLPPDEYWLPLPRSQPTDVVVDGDGCAWYTAPGVNRIGRLCLPLCYSIWLPLVSRN
jgi:streptogramin lyase